MSGPDGCTRRQFFRQAGLSGLAAGLSLRPLGRLANAIAGQAGEAPVTGETSLRNVRHVIVDRAPDGYCGSPRECGIGSFGDGELAVMYRRGAEVVLRRSTDGGETWPAADEAIVHSNALPVERQAEFLCRDPAGREVLDMNAPGAMFFFGRSPLRVSKKTRRDRWLGWYTEMTADPPPEEAEASGTGHSTVFQVRSTDRGRSWEQTPLVLDPPRGVASIRADNHPSVTMPDGALIQVMESDGALWLYGSECEGMTWQYLSMIATEQAGLGCPSSGGLILLPDGRVQCYLVMRGEQSGRLCVSETDNCFSWSQPRVIGRTDRYYDTPWPLRLRDGRIVLVFASRAEPFGIAAVISEDEGLTWSGEAFVRDYAAGPDIGWPVAVEVAEGRVFTAYQYQVEQGDAGARFVAGSFFEPA